MKRAILLNDGSPYSKARAREYRDKGYTLHSVYGRFSTDLDLPSLAAAGLIADKYCETHDVCTLEAWTEFEDVARHSDFRWTMFLTACTPAIRRHFNLGQSQGGNKYGGLIVSGIVVDRDIWENFVGYAKDLKGYYEFDGGFGDG